MLCQTPYHTMMLCQATYHMMMMLCQAPYHTMMLCWATYHTTMLCWATYHTMMLCWAPYHTTMLCWATYHTMILCQSCFSQNKAVSRLLITSWWRCVELLITQWCCVMFDQISPHCDTELKDSKPIFLHDTLAHDVVTRYQVWLQKVEGSAAEGISSRWTFTGILYLFCDLVLDHNRAI